MHRVLHVIRNSLEGFLCLLCFPVWLTLALSSCWSFPAVLAAEIKRWFLFLRSGLRLYRESWWPLPCYEKSSTFWRYWLWIEFFAARNLCRRLNQGRDRYLIIKLAHIGDAMHIAPMLEALKSRQPEAEIDLMVGPWCADLANRWQSKGNVWVYTPHLALFHRGNTKQLLSWRSEYQLLHAVRRRKYNVVLSTSTLTMAEWLLIQAANPDQWIGADNSITSYYPAIPKSTEAYASRAYESDRVGGLLRHLGLETASGLPGYPVRHEEMLQAEAWWTSFGAIRGTRVVVAPGAGWPGKIWPAERFGKLVDWLFVIFGCRIVLTGAPDEKALGAIIEASCPNVLNLIGKTTFGQTAGLVKTADLLLCNDSGPLHLAATFGTPSIALFGPTIASKWQPPGSQHAMIQKPGYCEGCVGWHPVARCLHNGACMKAISVEEVCHSVELLLHKKDRAT